MAKSKKTERETETEPVGLRLKKSLKTALEDLAEADRRPLASYIKIVLENHVEDMKGRPAAKKR